ncbi:MAG: D-2-hydroxyacid dehydrogenase [Bryobacteraceae bacterium]
MKLVVHPPIGEDRLAKLRAAAAPMIVVNAVDGETAAREIAGADAFFGKLTPRLLEAAGNLRWVQSPTASLEHYLFPALIGHPSVLTNMRGLFSDVIADHVMGFLLCFARNLHVYIRQTEWRPVGGEEARPSFTMGPAEVNAIDRAHFDLAGQTLGIVGLGAIGSEIARRASAFGMRIAGVDPKLEKSPDPSVTLWRMDRLPDLLEASRFVVIAAPHTPETERMFHAGVIRRMRRDAYLINIGRGAIVDLADLTDALRDEAIAGAALDVYEIEPLPPDHPLWSMPNVILTPHIAGASVRVAARHLEVLLENAHRFAHGEPLINVVNKQEWF